MLHAGMKTFMAGIKVGFRRSSEEEKRYEIKKGFPDISVPVLPLILCFKRKTLKLEAKFYRSKSRFDPVPKKIEKEVR